MLTIVPTPIGNLKDITLRALEVLKSSDEIICEDSRRSSLLLNHNQIKKPLLVLNDFNEYKTVPQIIEKLKSGKNLALISDAGTPLISDPGYKLVRECIKENLEVDSLPGAVSPIVALTLSGLPPDKFFFLGYLPEKSGNRQKILQQISEVAKICSTTFIIFVSPHKLKRTLSDLNENFGDINISLAKELTKIHQQVITGKISEIVEKIKTPKGEFILMLNLTGIKIS